MSFKTTLRGFLIAASFASISLVASCPADTWISNETIAAGCTQLVCAASNITSVVADVLEPLGNHTNATQILNSTLTSGATPASSWATYTVNGLLRIPGTAFPICTLYCSLHSDCSRIAVGSATMETHCHLSIAAYHLMLRLSTSDASIKSKADEEIVYSLLKAGGYKVANFFYSVASFSQDKAEKMEFEQTRYASLLKTHTPITPNMAGDLLRNGTPGNFCVIGGGQKSEADLAKQEKDKKALEASAKIFTNLGSALLIGLAINDFYNWNLKS